VSQIEFDIRAVKEIVSEKKGDFATQISFAGDNHLPILVCGVADLELVNMGDLDLGLAADTKQPQTPSPS
jgi:hypothetical protein